jgi:hypothetical protein
MQASISAFSNTRISLDASLEQTTMPLGKRWNLAEETILAKAYLAATQNPFKGADQTAIAFQNDLFDKFKSFSPEDAEDGRYYHRTGMAILEELRRLKADVQSFNKALNIVSASSPTGVTKDEEVAMAVAIHCKVTKRMDYHFKNFDVTAWKFFGAWNILKNSPKFQHHPPAPSYANNNNNNMHNGEATMNESGDNKENDASSPDSNVSFDVAYAKAPLFGRKSSIEKRRREKVEKEKEEAKKARHAEMLTSLNESKSYLAHISDVNEQVKKRTANVFTLGTTVFALKGSNDPEAVTVVKQCMASLIKKAQAAMDDKDGGGDDTTNH